MANVNTDIVTNFVATPQVKNDSQQLHGVKRIAQGTIALAAGDLSASDTVMLAPVPTNASISSIKLFNDDLDSNGSPSLAANVGLYYENGTVLDEDCYATAITTLQAAETSGAEVAFEARNVNAVSNFAWEDGGLSSDPGGALRIALTMSNAAATAAAGDVTLIVTYVVD